MSALASIPSMVKVQLIVAAAAIGITVWTAVKLPPLIREKQSLEQTIEKNEKSVALLESQLIQKKAELDATVQAAREAQTQLYSIQEQLSQLKRNLASPTKTQASNTSALKAVEEIDSSLSIAGAGLNMPIKDVKKDRYSGYSVDIFYCDDAGSRNIRSAESTAELGTAESQGRWRVRRLSPEINAQPGYNIHTDILRYNPSESETAEVLVRDILDRNQLSVRKMEISYPTPNYLSVFFCSAN